MKDSEEFNQYLDRLKAVVKQYNIDLNYIHGNDTRDLIENLSYIPNSLSSLVERLNIIVKSVGDYDMKKAFIEGAILGTNDVYSRRRRFNV